MDQVSVLCAQPHINETPKIRHGRFEISRTGQIRAWTDTIDQREIGEAFRARLLQIAQSPRWSQPHSGPSRTPVFWGRGACTLLTPHNASPIKPALADHRSSITSEFMRPCGSLGRQRIELENRPWRPRAISSGHPAPHSTSGVSLALRSDSRAAIAHVSRADLRVPCS